MNFTEIYFIEVGRIALGLIGIIGVSFIAVRFLERGILKFND